VPYHHSFVTFDARVGYRPKDFEWGCEGLNEMIFLLPPFLSISFDPFGKSAISRVARRFLVFANALGEIRRGSRFILCSLFALFSLV
jgi:hypothetical protein